MRRLFGFVFVALIVVTGCGDDGPDAASAPPAVVAAWAEAIEQRDFEAASNAVYEPSFIIVLASENGLAAAETATMLDEGVPPAVAASYWTTFREGFDTFAGHPISTLNVGESEEIEAGGVVWAVLPASTQSDASAPVFTRAGDSWLIDLVATLADGFVDPLAAYLESLPDDADGDRVRAAYTDAVAPALWAAIEAGDHGDAFARKALALINAAAG
jgi:hypothetical protein